MPASTREVTTSSRDGHGRAAETGNGRVQARDEGPMRGGVSIAESVIAKIAATAARQIPGIYPAGAGGGVARAISAGGEAGEGIRARIRREREVDLDMRMKVDYGEHIPTRGEQVRAAVAKAIRELTDLETREIKVKITEITLPPGRQAEPRVDEDGVEATA
jgi:uncharacterized alkaline shock family protein YloU